MKTFRLIIRIVNLVVVFGILFYLVTPGIICLWRVTTYKSPFKPVVLTEDHEFLINGKSVLLPSGLVLYPLNGGVYEEYSHEGDDGRKYKIYVQMDGLQFRQLDDEGREGTNLIWRLKSFPVE